MRVTVLVLAFWLCLPFAARAAPAVDVHFQPDQHVYVLPGTWHPSSMSPVGLSKLGESLKALPLPSYVVVARGEGIPAGTSVVRALDDLIDAWLQQGLTDRHTVMLLLWSDDCALPLRRPEHARCDYAIGIGAAVRSVGVTSSGAGAHALFERATSKRPVDPLHGMQEALRAIAEAEQEANARESLDRARAEADLDSAISLLRLLAEDPAANREERTMLNATADQASGARAAGSTRLMRDAQTLVESQVRLWVRLQEERRRVRTFRWAATTALGALAFLVMVFLWYRARRRLGTMTAAMDPAITDFDHYQARFGRAAIAVKELAQRISKVHEQLPPTATSAIVQLGGARRQFEEAERHIRAASSHLHSCAPLAGRTAKVLALFTGSCPGSDLGRRLRATYRVDMADSVSLHDAYVFGSATRTRFFSLEHAEGEVSRLYNEANGCVADVENAIQSVRTCIQVHRSGLEFNALSKRTETRHVPMVWLSQHPFLAEGPQFFLEAEMLADRNPVAAMSMIRDYERRHAEVSSVVDRIAQAITRVVNVRVADLSLPADICIDPADNPRNTLVLAQHAEEELLRLIEAPIDATSASPVESKAHETVGLYEKAIAQHGMVLHATRDAQKHYEEAEHRLTRIQLRLPSSQGSSIREIPGGDSRLLLAYLRVQVIKRDLSTAGHALTNKNWVSAMRTLDLVLPEIDRAEGLLDEVNPQQPQEAPMIDAEDTETQETENAANDKKDEKSSGGSVPPPKESSSTGGTVPPPR